MHSTSVLHSELIFWSFIINSAQLINLSMYKNIQAAEALNWCSVLKVIYEDYYCAILKCSYCAPQKIMILYHLHINYSSMKFKLNSYRHSVYLSTIFLKVAHHYYKITINTTVFSLTVPDLETALNDYN